MYFFGGNPSKRMSDLQNRQDRGPPPPVSDDSEAAIATDYATWTRRNCLLGNSSRSVVLFNVGAEQTSLDLNTC